MKGSDKHTEALLTCFDNRRCLSQSDESKCMWTHGKDVTTLPHGIVFTKGAFTNALQQPLSWVKSTYSFVLIPISLRSIIIFSLHLCLYLPVDLAVKILKGLLPPSILAGHKQKSPKKKSLQANQPIPYN